jgi:sugar phosphate isomerase/epimerase
MAQLSMNEMTTFRWSFEEDVHNYAAAGIPAIGVWRQKLSDFGEEKGIELISENGLAVSSLHWAGGFTGSDGRSYKESVEDAREAIRLAAALHARCLTVYSGARGGHTNNHARRLLKSALNELLPIACEFGVALALEPMHAGCAREWTFLTDLNETLGLLEEVNNPQLKLAFDTYHFGYDTSILDQIAGLAGHIAVVQLGDSGQLPEGEPNRCRLGDGIIPLERIVAALLDAGYGGHFEVKLLGEDLEPFDYNDLINHSKSEFESWGHASKMS